MSIMNINLKVNLQEKKLFQNFMKIIYAKLKLNAKKISGDLQIIKNLDLLKLLLNH